MSCFSVRAQIIAQVLLCSWYGERGVFGGGTGPTNTIEYITILTLGNTLDFGDLSLARFSVGSCLGGGRGIFLGSGNGTNGNTIDYITIATTGNATDFGDTNQLKYYSTAMSNNIRGVVTGALIYNNIDYVTITTTGNASDFGTFLTSRSYSTACSGN